MIPIIVSPYVPEFSNHKKTVPLSFFERWVKPMLHPVTVNFEPWVKTKEIEVSERTFFYMEDKILCHPNNEFYIKDKMNKTYPSSVIEGMV